MNFWLCNFSLILVFYIPQKFEKKLHIVLDGM